MAHPWIGIVPFVAVTGFYLCVASLLCTIIALYVMRLDTRPVTIALAAGSALYIVVYGVCIWIATPVIPGPVEYALVFIVTVLIYSPQVYGSRVMLSYLAERLSLGEGAPPKMIYGQLAMLTLGSWWTAAAFTQTS